MATVWNGSAPGWLLANEEWPAGCQSCVSNTCAKRCASRLMTGTTASPSATASAPPGQKSFCTSITSSRSSARMSMSGGGPLDCGDGIAVAPTAGDHLTGVHLGDKVAIGACLDRDHAGHIDEPGAVNPHEAERPEPALFTRQRAADQMPRIRQRKLDIVSGRRH